MTPGRSLRPRRDGVRPYPAALARYAPPPCAAPSTHCTHGRGPPARRLRTHRPGAGRRSYERLPVGCGARGPPPLILRGFAPERTHGREPESDRTTTVAGIHLYLSLRYDVPTSTSLKSREGEIYCPQTTTFDRDSAPLSPPAAHPLGCARLDARRLYCPAACVPARSSPPDWRPPPVLPSMCHRLLPLLQQHPCSPLLPMS